MHDDDVARLAGNLSRNLRVLRAARGLTQQGLAEASGVPRATIAKLEAGSPNPTLATAVRLAHALRASIEELVAPPRVAGRLVRAGDLPQRRVGGVELRSLLPHPLPGLMLERIALPASSRMKGVPHVAEEYLVCESGRVQLATPGGSWILGPGDVLVYDGDQPHGYTNPDDRPAAAFTVVVAEPTRPT